MQHLFISYSHRDIEFMRHIGRFLQGKEFAIWSDENLTPGTRGWKLAIEKAIEEASAVVAILSPDAKASEWVDRELEYARIRGKRIFPLLVRGDAQTSVPLELVTSQWIDLTSREHYQPGMEKLVLALDNHLGIKRAKSRTEQIQDELAQIMNKLPECYYIAVVSVDGLLIAFCEPESDTPHLEEDRVSAMSAASLALGERISSELGGGGYRFSVIAGQQGMQFVVGLWDESEVEGDFVLAFGLRKITSLDAALVILRQ
jgi:predicted regulator of Ras-like GTPase activity (Roadblock/LC7/MglB family)